jgi:hypothetical protein
MGRGRARQTAAPGARHSPPRGARRAHNSPSVPGRSALGHFWRYFRGSWLSRACLNAPRRAQQPCGFMVRKVLPWPVSAVADGSGVAGLSSRNGCGGPLRDGGVLSGHSHTGPPAPSLSRTDSRAAHNDEAPQKAPRRVVLLRRLAAPPAREKTDREEGNDDDDDPQDSAEDAPPFDDTRSFRPFDLIQERLANDEAPPKGATSNPRIRSCQSGSSSGTFCGVTSRHTVLKRCHFVATNLAASRVTQVASKQKPAVSSGLVRSG